MDRGKLETRDSLNTVVMQVGDIEAHAFNIRWKSMPVAMKKFAISDPWPCLCGLTSGG